MKTNILLLSSLVSFFFSTAQNTIVDDIYEKGNKPVDFSLLTKSKKVIIYKGKKIGGLVAGSKTTDIYSYDLEGNKTVIAENKEFYQCGFSPSKNTLRVYDISESVFKAKQVFYKDGKFTKPYPTEQNEPYSRVFPYYANFTDQYTLVLRNAVNQQKYNFGEDIFYNLILTDNYTHKKSKVKVMAPNSKRITSPGMVKPAKKLDFTCGLNSDDTFTFITKSITEDYTKSILYRTTHNLEGVIISDVPFEVNLKDKTLIYSNNGGGFTDSPPNKAAPFFADDLSINNYIVDQSNGDIFVYGLYGDKAFDLNKDANPKGYYVFKFDKDGKKIWESINKIEDKDFNEKHYMYYTNTDLAFINNKLCFYAFVNEHDEYLNYGILDQATGTQEKNKKIVFHEYESRVGVGSDFFKLNFEYKNIKELKNKKFNVFGIIAYDNNSKYADYVKNVKIKGETHFLTMFNDFGMLVIETDNEEYYKVLYFKE